MVTQYLALVHKAPGFRFGVTFPDLPGCVAAGDSASAALASARGALALHIDGMTENGDPLPPARGMDEILADPAGAEEAKGALWAVVPVMSRGGRSAWPHPLGVPGQGRAPLGRSGRYLTSLGKHHRRFIPACAGNAMQNSNTENFVDRKCDEPFSDALNLIQAQFRLDVAAQVNIITVQDRTRPVAKLCWRRSTPNWINKALLRCSRLAPRRGQLLEPHAFTTIPSALRC